METHLTSHKRGLNNVGLCHLYVIYMSDLCHIYVGMYFCFVLISN